MAFTDVLHVSCMAGQSVFVCMKDLYTGPAGCLNAPTGLYLHITILSLPDLVLCNCNFAIDHVLQALNLLSSFFFLTGGNRFHVYVMFKENKAVATEKKKDTKRQESE